MSFPPSKTIRKAVVSMRMTFDRTDQEWMTQRDQDSSWVKDEKLYFACNQRQFPGKRFFEAGFYIYIYFFSWNWQLKTEINSESEKQSEDVTVLIGQDLIRSSLSHFW